MRDVYNFRIKQASQSFTIGLVAVEEKVDFDQLATPAPKSKSHAYETVGQLLGLNS
jgi:hypothetical protein